jgi:three-Cys-motif partner protein
LECQKYHPAGTEGGILQKMTSPKYDEIGYWSEIKLEIVKDYANAYSQIMNATPVIKNHIYIDAFAGSGKHLSKRTGEFVPGSPLNALLVTPPFSEFHFIDLDGGKAQELRRIAGGRKDVIIHEGDCNEVLLKEVFTRCQYKSYHRALCLLDPYAINVNWEVLQTAGQMESIEIFYNFMIMDANMNVFWRNPDKVHSSQKARMDQAWGDRSWSNAAYRKTPGLFGEMEEKADNEAVVEAFRRRLKEVAGFKYVPAPLPMRNAKGAVIYYLFFASPNKTGGEIVKQIFEKYSRKGVN